MDAKELRIGNYITVDDDNGNHVESLVNTLTDGLLGFTEIHTKESYEVFWGKEIKPIPLTKEWLKKLDFVYGRYTEGWKLNYADDYIEPIRYHKGNYTMLLNRMWVKIKYVHQLQNLYYSLTGKELNVNN